MCLHKLSCKCTDDDPRNRCLELIPTGVTEEGEKDMQGRA